MSEQLSLYNAIYVDNEQFNFANIVDIIHNKIDGTVKVIYFDGSEKNLGGYVPLPDPDFVGGSIRGNNLFLQLSNGQEIDVGDVRPNVDYGLPDILGHGILTPTGQYKSIVSDDPTITIEEKENELIISASSSNATAVTDFLFEKATHLRETFVSSATGLISLGALPADTFTDIAWDRSGSEFTLTPGLYWIEANTSAHQTGLSYLQLVNLSGAVLLEGTRAVLPANSVVGATLKLSGWVRTTDPLVVKLRRYSQLSATNGKGRGNFSAVWGMSTVVSKMSIWRSEKTSISQANINVPTLSTKAQAWKDLYDQRKDNPFRVVDEFSDLGTTELFYGLQASFGDEIFFIPNRVADCILVFNTVTEKTRKIYLSSTVKTAIQGSSGTYNYLCGALVGNEYYCIPYSAGPILIINLVTGETRTTTFGLTMAAGGTGYTSCAYHPATGRLIAVPLSETRFLVIDVPNQTAQFTTLGVSMASGFKWGGATLVGDHIYAIPFDDTRVLKINAITLTVESFSVSSSGGNKYWGCFYSPTQRKVIGIPLSARNFLVFDIDTNTAITDTFGCPAPAETGYRFAATNGQFAYGYPVSGNLYFQANLETLAFVWRRMSLTNAANEIWPCAVVGSQNKLIPSPTSSNTIEQLRVLDANTGLVRLVHSGLSRIGTTSTTNSWKFTAAALADNGLAYAFPSGADYVLVFDSDNFWRLEYKAEITDSGSPHRYSDTINVPGDGVYGIPYSATHIAKIVPPGAQGTPRIPGPMHNGERLFNAYDPVIEDTNATSYITHGGQFQSSSYAARNAFRIRDINVNTECWTSTSRAFNQANPHFVQIWLTHPVPIFAFQLKNGYDYFPRTGRLLGSLDGQTWVTLHEYNNPTNTTAFRWGPVVEVINPGNYRVFRFEFYSSTHSGYVSLAECRFYTRQAHDPNNFLGRVELVAAKPTGALLGSAYHDPVGNRLFIAPTFVNYLTVFNLQTRQFSTIEANDQTSLVPFSTGSNRFYYGLARYSDTDLVYHNANSNELVFIDTQRLRLYRKDFAGNTLVDSTIETGYTYRGPDDLIYLVPIASPTMAVIDPKDHTAFVDTMGGNKNTDQFGGMVPMFNGKYLIYPHSGNNVWFYDSYEGVWENRGIPAVGTRAFHTAVTFPNGCTVVIPFATSPRVIKVIPDTPSPIPLSVLQ